MTLASHRWRLVVALECTRAGAGARAKGGRPPPPRPPSSLSSTVALECARAGADARADRRRHGADACVLADALQCWHG